MHLCKYKRWRVLLHKMIAKEQAKREHTHPVYLHAVEKDKKVEKANTQNDYQTSKKSTDKKKPDLIFMFCKCV